MLFIIGILNYSPFLYNYSSCIYSVYVPFIVSPMCNNNIESGVFVFCFFFGPTLRHVRPEFPNQGSSWYPLNWKAES